ncbi:MAG TPA: hypothetical protein VJ727_06940 [Rhodanobacteraceae bacterium]|nr:hypothetical protein [Rhodanobacteraceae bacterium]
MSIIAIIATVALSAGPKVQFQIGRQFQTDPSMPRYFAGLPEKDGQIYRSGRWISVPGFSDYGMRWADDNLIVEAWVQRGGSGHPVENSGKAVLDGRELLLTYGACHNEGVIAMWIGHENIRWIISGIPKRDYRVTIKRVDAGRC